MANVNEYLCWRGDLTFEQSPFNEVDGLILAYLSYVPMEGIVASPWEEDRITVKEGACRFWEKNDEREFLEGISLVKMAPFVMRRLAATKRFQDAKLCYFQNSVNLEEESQFCGLCIELTKDLNYIAFRGTDSSLIGWKENLRMSYEVVPAQNKARDYLNYVGRKIDGKIYVGGHSKGGNLATFAAAMAQEEVKEKIAGIYNFDGPGFMEAFLKSGEYQSIQKVYHKLVPKDSMVGMILGHDSHYEVVECESPGIRQHDPLCWRIAGTEFPRLTKRSEQSYRTEKGIRNCLNDLSDKEKAKIIDILFRSFQEDELKSMNELRHILTTKRLRNAWLIDHRKLQQHVEIQKLIQSATREFRTEIGHIIFPKIR